MKRQASWAGLKAASAIVPFLAISLLTACDSTSATSGVSGGAVSAPSTSQTDPAAPSSPGAPTAATPGTTGESCVSNDPSKICLGVHFVSYQDSSGAPVASAGQVATIVHTMNTIWSQCGIGFQVEKFETVDPTKSGLSFGSSSQNELNQIRNTYTTTNDQLLAVNTGPWGTAVNAWTNMPGSGPYGAIMEASIVTYGNGIIHAHEFGHYLGLDHVGDTSNLMNAVIYTTSNKLTTSQCQQAQQVVSSYWSAMLRH